ncbi:hypothetical protein Aduo_019973 [Ancylostoma duodenale]
MIPLFGLFVVIVCFLSTEAEVRYDEQLLYGCKDTDRTAFNDDWGLRAYLYSILAKTAGYGHSLMYSCAMEEEAVDTEIGGLKTPQTGSVLLNYEEADPRRYYDYHRYDDYHLLLEAGKVMGKQLRDIPGNKTMIGCSYKKYRKTICIAF